MLESFFRVVIFLVIFAVTWGGVGIFRRWSSRRGLLDLPNERSSHTIPTPRGGGIIICLVFLTALLIEGFVRDSHDLPWGYVAGAVLVASISWIDDLRSVPVLFRFLCHTAAAMLVTLDLGYFSEIYVPFYGVIIPGFWAVPLTLFWIVWMINSYNFMDGIDGLAGLQAVTAGLGWLFAGAFLGFNELSFYGGVLAFSAAGFLIHNWSPAKIFMGDVGSAFLGYTLAVMPLLARTKGELEASILPVLAGAFVWFFFIDSFLTFFRRLFKGEKVWQAHRRHIYQRLVGAGYSHGFVTGLYGLASSIVLICVLLGIKLKTNLDTIMTAPILILTVLLLIFSYKTKEEA